MLVTIVWCALCVVTVLWLFSPVFESFVSTIIKYKRAMHEIKKDEIEHDNTKDDTKDTEHE